MIKTVDLLKLGTSKGTDLGALVDEKYWTSIVISEDGRQGESS